MSSRAKGTTGVHGRVRAIVRELDDVTLERVFDNIETTAALNAIAAAIISGAIAKPPKYLSLGMGPVNMLSDVQSDIETTPTGWEASSNCTVAQSSAQAWHGGSCLAITASASGAAVATTTPGTSAVAVTTGDVYCASAYVRAAATSRTVTLQIAWYDSTGTLLSTSSGTGRADSTSGWTRVGVVATAPASAAYAAVQASIASAVSSEVHYLDGVLLAYAPDGGHYPWSAGGQTGVPAASDTGLYMERYQTRSQIDSSFTQAALAVLLHGYGTTAPNGDFTEAGLWDANVASTTLAAQTAVGDTAFTVAAGGPAVASGIQVIIGAYPLASPNISSLTGAATTGGYLIGGDAYYYKVTALNSIGETIPGAETSYTVPAGTNTNQITLNWPTSPGATSYKIYRATTSGGELYLATVTASAAATTLTASITSAQTTITVASASGFPGSGNYTILVDSEEMTVTGGQGTTTWTVTRGVNGSTAAAHNNAAAVALETSYTDNSNTTPTGTPPSSDTSGGETEYATLVGAVAAGGTAWTVADQLLSGHPDGAPVVAMNGTLWGHVVLTGISKNTTQILSLQWELQIENA